ncbi:MAG TPA: hypothetical protein VFW86_03830, partial [Candidatus Limnocylindrales bacterium]|nr:hypothetical protein [Candidatus Limnocylindrales bacterium]
MPTLLDLWRAVLPAAVPAAPGPAEELALARDVSWVRVLKARVPAFDALEPGDLALLPEAAIEALAEGSVEPATLVEAIAEAGAAGIVLVGDGEPSSTAAAAGQRSLQLGLPSLRMTAQDPAALERAVIGYLVDARGELERQAGGLEAGLERLALQDRDLTEFAAAIADFIGRGVALEGPGGETLAAHLPAGRTGATAELRRYQAQPQRAALRVRLADVGSLALLGEAPPTERERAALARVSGVLAIAVRRQAREPASGVPTEPVPAAGPPWAFLMARQLEPERPASLEERQAVRDRLRQLAPARRLGLRGDATSLELRLVVVPEAGDPLALGLAEQAARFLGRTVAVSRPFTQAEDRPLAEAEARATLEAFEALRPGERPIEGHGAAPVARADRLPAYRLLGNLHNLPDGVAQAEAFLAPILLA